MTFTSDKHFAQVVVDHKLLEMAMGKGGEVLSSIKGIK
jgi:transcription antitermination factor NusA-like protein